MLIDNIIEQANVKKQEYSIFLYKANRELIREITAQCSGAEYNATLSGCNTFSFSINKFYDEKEVQDYDSIIGGSLVKIERGSQEIGYFEIQNPEIETDGITETKDVKAISCEISLAYRKIYVTEGTFKLTNESNPDSGLLNIINGIVPSWSIGYVDSSLINKERYLDISDTNIYDLLINTVQETFECVFVFDTINRNINVYSLSEFGSDTKIILTMQNLLKTASVEEISDEIITKLHLYGDNGVTVREINYGNDFIENYDYFKDTKFMSQDLIDALDDYAILLASYTTVYSNYLVSLSTFQASLVTKTTDLSILETELQSLDDQKSFLESIGESTTSISNSITNKESEISSKENEISSVNSSITSINSNIDSILTTISKGNNFTEDQIIEMDSFIKEDTYQDSTFVVGDSFTYNETADIQKELLSLGQDILLRSSYPKYKVTIDSIDFFKLVEYANWWNELNIGDTLYIKVNKSFTAEVRIVGYTHNSDNNKLTIQLGDKYSFDDANIQLLDLIKNSISTSTTVNYKSQTWGDWNSNKNDVLDFINSSLDLNNNNVVGGINQEMLFNSSGLLMRRWDEDVTDYSPKQLKITNNSIVLSDDAFESAKTAIGQLSNGLYGIAAEIIAGKMILGNNLIIETGSGDFRVDGDGVNITSMAMNLTSDDNLKNILINPDIGIKLRSRTSTSQSFVDTLYFDISDKKLKFGGDLEAVGGTFTGTLSGVDGNFSGEISGSTIIGGTITGAIIKTASSGTRLQLASNKFNSYNSLNEKTGVQIESYDSQYSLVFTDDSYVEASINYDTAGSLNMSALDDNYLNLYGGGRVSITSPKIVSITANDGLYYNNAEVATEIYVKSYVKNEIANIPPSTSIEVWGGSGIDVKEDGDNRIISVDTSKVPTTRGQYIRFQVVDGLLEFYYDGDWTALENY